MISPLASGSQQAAAIRRQGAFCDIGLLQFELWSAVWLQVFAE